MSKTIINLDYTNKNTKLEIMKTEDYIQSIANILNDPEFSKVLEEKFKNQYTKLKKWTKLLNHSKKELDDSKTQIYLSKIYRLLKKLDVEVKKIDCSSQSIEKRYIKSINRQCNPSIVSTFCGNGGVDFREVNTSFNGNFMDITVLDYVKKINLSVKTKSKENISNLSRNIYKEISCKINSYINIIKEKIFVSFNLLISNVISFSINKDFFYKPKVSFELKLIRGRAPNHSFLIA